MGGHGYFSTLPYPASQPPSLCRLRSPTPESEVGARGPAESSARERCARGRPEHKAAPSRPATAPGPGPALAHGAWADTKHAGLGRGSGSARPRGLSSKQTSDSRAPPPSFAAGLQPRAFADTTPAPTGETRAEEGAGRWGPREVGGRGLGERENRERDEEWEGGQLRKEIRSPLGGCKSALPGSSSAHSANLRVGGAAALRSPRALARASDKAPLTQAPLCVCIFFSLPLAPGTGRRPPPPPLPRPPPPFPGRITFPGLRSGSPGCLQRPVCGRAIAEPPKPAGSSAGGGRGEGRGRARTFDPGGPRRRSRAWRVARGRGASGARGRCGGRWRGREQPRSGERASEGARRGSEGAASEGSASGAVTGTATGVKGAQLQEAGPPQRRSL